MTEIKTKEDLREQLFDKYAKEGWNGDVACVGPDDAKLMLDEYWEKRAMELLEYMAKNNIECFSNEKGCVFLDKKHGYQTREELFKNFL